MNCLEFKKKVFDWVTQEKLLEPGDGVVAAVSGGADSVALLHFFCSLKRAMNLPLLCVHVEHGIRGEDSLADQAFVEELCRRKSVPCHVVSLGNALNAEHEAKGALEERARSLRYEVLEHEAEEMERRIGRPVKIAVAHHMEDNVETMLFHLARGTGLKGLAGMPVRRGRIIRPFYPVSRLEIEEYLKELGETFCEDSTNADIAYQRNHIRHVVLPELKQVNEQAVEHMGRTAQLLREVEEYIECRAGDLLHLAECGEAELSFAPLQQIPDFLKRQVIHLWLEKFVPGRKDIGACHLFELAALENKQVGRQICLPGDWIAVRTYRGLQLQRNGRPKMKEKEEKALFLPLDQVKLERENSLELHSEGKIISFRLFSGEEVGKNPRNSYTKVFDYDRIKNNVVVRTRAAGDYFMLNDRGGRKKLSDYMVNEKIPARRRDDVLLLCDGHHVIWVIGYRTSGYYRADTTTKRILEVQISEDKGNE